MCKVLSKAYTEAEERLEKWIDDYLSGKIDDESFSILVILNQLEKRLSYISPIGLIGVIRGYVSDKHLTSKEKQQVKETFTKITRIWNDPEISKNERNDVIAECEDLLEEIIKFVSIGNHQ